MYGMLYLSRRQLHEKTGNYVRNLLMGLFLIAKAITFGAWFAGCYPVKAIAEYSA